MPKEKFDLTITTNDRFSYAGTDASVKCKIIGEGGKSTGWKDLDHFLYNDFKKGATDKYTILHEDEPTGPPVLICLKLAGFTSKDGWLCNDVIIVHDGKTYEFPVYEWISGEETIYARGEATLPQNVDNSLVRLARKRELEACKIAFQWTPIPLEDSALSWGLNRYIKGDGYFDLPDLFRRTNSGIHDFLAGGVGAGLNAAKNLFGCITSKLECLDDYCKLYEGTGYENPCFFPVWKEDAEQGRQLLTGITPLATTRCKKLPSYCNITAETVSGLFENGGTLESEMEAGKIYFADYSDLATLDRNQSPSGEQLYCANAMCLYYATPDGKFTPIAIQLEPNDKDYVFTRNDSEYDWLMAKIYYRGSVESRHEWVYHYMLTHGVSETFAVSTFRNLPRAHPIYKLLRPHLCTVSAINVQARELLIPPGSPANISNAISASSTVRAAYKTFHFSDLDIPKHLKKRGLDDTKVLPNNPYRDDALDVWAAIETFIRQTIKHYYKSDADVANDFEIQNWVDDMANEGFAWQDGNKRGCPDKLNTVEEMINLCTIIVFTSSAQHAAVNFGQMETYMFVPNATGSMMKPPHKRGEGSFKRMMDSLPGVLISSILIGFSYTLSDYAKDAVFLGDVIERLFVESEIEGYHKQFKSTLDKLEEKFENRNKSLTYPYVYLLPSKIPISIAI